MASLIATKPFKSRDRIIGYVTHALHNDLSDQLDLPERKLNFIYYYNIDYIVIIGLTLLFLGWIVWKISKICIFYCYSKACNPYETVKSK